MMNRFYVSPNSLGWEIIDTKTNTVALPAINYILYHDIEEICRYLNYWAEASGIEEEYKRGYTDGYHEGSNDGYDIGYFDGTHDGYDTGWAECIEKQKNKQ